MSTGTRRLLACLLGLFVIATAESAAPPVVRVDAFGDPLPRGGVARLGTARWRHDGAAAFAFDRAGDTLVSVGSGAVRFWDARTGRVVRSFPVENGFDPGQLSLPVAGHVIVTGKSDKVVAYEAKSGKELWHLDDSAGRRFESAAVSPDGSVVAVGMGSGAIEIREAKTGKRLHALDGGKRSICHLDFSADGGRLLSVEAKRLSQWQFDTARTLRVWDASAGKKICEWEEGFGRSAALSPDGKTVASALNGILWFYDIGGGKNLPKFETPSNGTRSLGTSRDPMGVCYGLDGTLALCYENRVEVWDVRKSKLIREVWAEAHQVALRRDGRMLAMNSGWQAGKRAHFSLIDLGTGKGAYGLPIAPGLIGELVVSGDGKLVAAATGLGETLLWDANTGKRIGRLPPPRRTVRPWGVQFVEGGTSLASVGIRSPSAKTGGDRHDIILWSWDFLRGRESWPEVPLGGKGAWFSFDPRGVSFAHQTESNITIRNLATGKLRREIPLRKDERGRPVRADLFLFTPDGHGLAVSGGHTGSEVVEVWKLKLDEPTGKVREKRAGNGLVFGFAGYGRHLLVKRDFRKDWWALDLWGGGKRKLDLPPSMSRSGFPPRDTISPNGLWVARTDQTKLELIEIATGRVVLTWRGDPYFPDNPGWRPCAWMPDGKRLVVGLRPPLVLDLPLCADTPAAAGLSGDARRAALWADLGGKDSAAAFKAVCWLATHPDDALPMLEGRLKPVPGPDLASIRKLIAELDDDGFRVREDAQARLAKFGHSAKSLLEEVVEDDKASLERHHRARLLLAAIKPPADAAERLREDQAHLRALQVLEWIASPRARKHLKALSEGDPDVALTRYARSALGLIR